MARAAETPKQFSDLTLELLQSLQVVRDSTRALQSGAAHQILPLAGQLRALLLEKRRDAHALLLYFASTAKVEPTLYVMPDTSTLLPAALPQPSVRVAGFPFTTSRMLPKQTKIGLDELADRELVRFQDQGYSIDYLIKYFANIAGGAHFSKSISEPVAQLLSYEAPGLSMRAILLKAFAQMGQAVFEVGLSIVRRLTDLDVFMDLLVLHPEPGAIIFDASYPSSHMRITLHIDDDLHLAVRVVGLDGTEVSLRATEPLAPGEHIVRISLRHDEELCGQIALMHNGTAAEAFTTVPLFLSHDFIDYHLSLNSGVHGEGNRGAGFGLAEWCVYAGVTADDADSVADHLAEGHADPERTVVFFEAGGTGQAAPGTNDLTLTGARHWKVIDLIGGLS